MLQLLVNGDVGLVRVVDGVDVRRDRVHVHDTGAAAALEVASRGRIEWRYRRGLVDCPLLWRPVWISEEVDEEVEEPGNNSMVLDEVRGDGRNGK